jgi:hypothetical protein
MFTNMFKSYFLAGFECSTGYNVHRQWIDQVSATCHDKYVDEDYGLLRDVGIRAAREAIRWPLVDNNGSYDFSTVKPIIEASRKHGIDIIFDLFHYGYPDHINLFNEDFPKRFADYCYATARYVTSHAESTCYFTPINEPSYFAWAAGEVGVFAPHFKGRGWELKIRLAKAAIAGINAIWDACPNARIVNVDPVCRVTAPMDQPDLQRDVDNFNYNAVFQSWDMLSGRLLPELGGSPRHLDIIGINYYWTNQWDITQPGVPLRSDDPRYMPLRNLIRYVWQRYETEILITETSHVEEMRPLWLKELVEEAEAVLDENIPLGGICLYPILGMPEWHEQHVWTLMGLWDLIQEGETLCRVPYAPMIEALYEAQQRLENRYQASLKREDNDNDLLEVDINLSMDEALGLA